MIVGSSAGALIGLQFVVISLFSNLPARPGIDQAGHAFSTPTIVHFGTVLLLSAALSAPWHGIAGAAVFCGVVGTIGLTYAFIVAWRMRKQTLYQPVFEDWLFHVLLPFAAYATLTLSAYATRTHAHEALFAVASAALLLLFSGIHNAWDAVTYHVYTQKPKQE